MDGMLGANTQETVALWKYTNKQTKIKGEERGDEGETRKRQERDDLGNYFLYCQTSASAELFTSKTIA